jgi:hypothetical protein
MIQSPLNRLLGRRLVLPLVVAALCSFAVFASSIENPSNHGAKGDGKTDDTAAIRKALELAAKGSLVVQLDPGAYRITGTLEVPDHVALRGASPRWEDGSTRIVIEDNGFSAVRLHNGSAVKALLFAYPNNAKGPDPDPYPPTIEVVGINPSVEQIVFVNAWIGVSTPPEGANAGQAVFRDLTGFIHKTGISLDGPRDIVRIQDVHWFFPGFTADSTPGKKDALFRTERVGFEFGRVDGMIMSQCFMIGGKTFVHQVAETAAGEKTHSLGLHITQSWVEDVTYGFLIEGTCGLVLSDTQIYISDPKGAGVAMRMPNLFYGSSIRGIQIRSDGALATGIEYAPTDEHIRNHLLLSGVETQETRVGIRLGPGARRVSIADSFVRAIETAIEIAPGAQELSIHDNLLGAPQGIVYEGEAPPNSNIKGNLEVE